MKLLYTKCDTIISRLVRWALDEPISHVAAVTACGIVFHSELTGVKITSLSAYIRDNEVVYSQRIALTDEPRVIHDLVEEIAHRRYDISAMLYLGFRAILRKLCGLPLGNKNRLNKSHRFICTEIIKYIDNETLQEQIKDVDLSMISPYHLYLLLERSSR